MDAKTQEYLNKMGPYYHMTLLHHHNITLKLNNDTSIIEDDTLVTFDTAMGEYNIKYGKLKEFAAIEQEKFIKENGNKQ